MSAATHYRLARWGATFVLVGLIALLSPATAGSEESVPASVWILGDSLTRGLYASSEATTFRNRLFAALQDRYPGQVTLLQWRSYCTLATVEAGWSALEGTADLIFLEIGINDVTQNPNCTQIPEDEWAARYGALLDRMQQDMPGVRIIVGTIPWSGWPEGHEYRARAIQYSEWIRSEAWARGIPVADLWAATVDRPDGLSVPGEPSPYPPGYQGDNFHPNDIGHARIAEAFYDAYVMSYVLSRRSFVPSLEFGSTQ